MKIKVKTVGNSLRWENIGNCEGVPFNFAIKLYTNHQFLFIQFFEISIVILRFFVISIFVVVKDHVRNRKRIFMLFSVFVRHFLVYLSELFWSEFVRAAIFIMLLPFYFAALNVSIYLPAIYLLICLYEAICPSLLKAVLLAKTVPLIKTIYCEIQIQTKVLYEFYWVLQICAIIKNC